ncbi:hypothetical protein CRI94_08125 [Longibacter salinarum]|uniref:Uncharacterized protein n=1 Tax=Longibacter salinarum TaxID=1850348 RepID=A0A2A8CZK2_9BACT|nr:hypothetical protein [Longibacter salinarum]PEN14007.1 hypothetical protein CRI94_08125 [Longibacter salinarum]
MALPSHLAIMPLNWRLHSVAWAGILFVSSLVGGGMTSGSAIAQAGDRTWVDTTEGTDVAPYAKICASRTGTDATIIFPDTARVVVDGAPIEPGDQIAVFTSEDRCAGYVTWSGSSVALAVWADDPMTEEVEGMRAGEKMRFRIRTKASRVKGGDDNRRFAIALSDAKPYLTSTETFVPNGIYVVRELKFGRLEHAEAGD